jgi:hypothetical protein
MIFGDKGIRLAVANFVFAPSSPSAQPRRVLAAHLQQQSFRFEIIVGLLRFESPKIYVVL